MTAPTPGPSSTGLSANVAGALSYLLAPFTGILFFVLERESSFVRFHAMQSIVFGVAWIAVWVVISFLSIIPIIGWIAEALLAIVVGFGGLVLWLLLIWKAFQGQEWELPVLGAMARRQLGQSV